MEIDEVDRAILFVLQEKSRSDLTHSEIADLIGVSQSTVAHRLTRLKESGVLHHFKPIIDYERVGLSHHVLFVCSASLGQRRELAERLLEIPKVLNVREFLSTTENLHVEVVASTASEIETAAIQIEDLGVTIDRSEILRREHCDGLDELGSDVVDSSMVE